MKDKVRKISWKWWLIPLIIVFGLIIVYVWVTGPTERVNKNVPTGMLYLSGEIPESYLLVGTLDGGIVDNELILADPITGEFHCKKLEESNIIYGGEKVEYYSYSPGWGVMGGWSFRYAMLCGENYFVIDGKDSMGMRMYGPFKR